MSNVLNLSSVESPFSFRELFFSRTDKRGVILSGNSIFQRVSEYGWNDLLNKPHNVIRHDDMPKGVFYLFWDTINNNKPIGAYVKNRSRTGKYYWVFALALPVESGFLSIRVKPSGPIFEIVQKEYAKLKSLESQKRISPKESQDILLSDLSALGFKDYSSFMITALKEVLEQRRMQMGLPPIQILTQLSAVLESGSKLQIKSQEILKAFSVSALVPLNLEIKTNRLGEEAAPLAVVASKYETMVKEIQKEIYSFIEVREKATELINQSQFEICAAILQSEVYEFFSSETQAGPIDLDLELKILSEVKSTGLAKACEAIKKVESESYGFEKKCLDLRTASTGLEIVRLTGKIEAAKINDQTNELNDLIGQLTTFREKLSSSLREIEIINRGLKSQTHDLAKNVAGL